MIEFTLADYNSSSSLGLIVENIERTTIDITSNTTEIPGRRGHVYEGNQVGAKVFSFTCFIDSNTEAERVQKGSELAQFFDQMSDGKLYKLTLTDEPGVFYWVYPTNVSNIARTADGLTTGGFTFDLVSPEALSYKELTTYDIPNSVVNIELSGTAKTPPVIFLNTQENLKEITVSNGEDYVSISKDVETLSNVYYLNDECHELTPWTKLTNETISFTPQDGVVANNADVKIEGAHKTMVSTWGTNPNGVQDRKWYGPARRRDFGKELENFEIWMSVEFYNYYPRAFNKLEVYLLDNLGNRIGKLWIKDEGVSKSNLIGIEIFKDGDRVQVGTNTGMGLNKTNVGSKKAKEITLRRELKEVDVAEGENVGEIKSKKYTLSQDTSTNSVSNFVGVIGLRKEGSKYTAAIQYMDIYGKPYGQLYTQTFTDIDERFGSKVAGLTYYFGKKNIYEDEAIPPTSYKGNYVSLRHIRVKELKASNGVFVNPYVAEPGDEIIIDCGNKRVYKNGSLFMENLNIGSNFFTLLGNEQENLLAFEPQPSANNVWKIDINERGH